MKLGTESRTKTYVALGLGVIALLLVVRTVFVSTGGSTTSASAGSDNSATTSQPAANAKPANAKPSSPIFSNLDPSLRLDLLKGSEDVAYSGSGRDIFRGVPEATPTPPPLKEKPYQAGPPTPTPPPPPPPINLKFFGFANNRGDNIKRIFLSEGDDVLIAKEGDIVKGRYRIVKVNANSVEVEDVLNNNHQTIPLTAG